MRKWMGILLFCSVIMAQPAFGQEVGARGSEAFSMGASSNSASIGYWHKMTEENSLGGDFAFFFNDSGHSDSQGYQFSPGIRHYLMPHQAVSPYLYGSLIGRYSKYSSNYSDRSSRTESYTAGLEGGIGLEWFPVQRVSVAGHVGLIAQYEKEHSNTTYSTTPSFNSSSTEEGFTTGTISSGVKLNFYF